MESWNSVINTALLGTEKRSLKADDVDPAFAEGFSVLEAGTPGREELFLQRASLVYNYRQCGFVPVQKTTVSLPQAEEEEKRYASLGAHSLLAEVLETGSVSLLRVWLEQCGRAEKIVLPEAIPILLTAGVKTKPLQPLITTCCGKRGEWLQQFNEEWRWYLTVGGNDVWETGTLQQRKEFLAELRKSDPAHARELLQQTWPQESAANKAELLQLLQVNTGADDVAWLKEVLNEKSVKVKETALSILKTIPEASLVQRYWNIVQNSVRLVTAKGLFGIGSKTTVEIKLAPVDPAIFKTGIQALSSTAKTGDDDFVLYQLIESVPPAFWRRHLQLDDTKVLALFSKEERTRSFIPAFASAAIRFKDLPWLRAVLDVDRERQYAEAYALLPQQEAEQYALRFLPVVTDAGIVLQHLQHFTAEWSPDFASAVLRFTAKNPYAYQRGFYNDIVALLPVSLAGELERCTPKEEHQRIQWSNLSNHLMKLLTLKLQTRKAFNEGDKKID